MPKKRYIISLSEAERQQLEALATTGKNAAYVITRAHILLKANTDQPSGGQCDAEISKTLNVSVPTIERLRRRFVEEGLETALKRQPRPYSPQRRLDGEQEAHLIALACSEPPTGQGRWSLRLLARHTVSLGYVESLSYETVRRTLKKNTLKPWLNQSWVIPPKANAAFVCQMEEILQLYTRPYDSRYPLVCFDETSKQLVSETRRISQTRTSTHLLSEAAQQLKAVV